MDDKEINKKTKKFLTKASAIVKYKGLSSEEENKSDDSFEDLVEAKIKKAMADGAFTNLQGKGEPLDLNRYYRTPGHLRLGYQVLKNAGFVPEEVRLKKEMEEIREKIRKCRSEKKKNKLMKELSEISQQFHFCMEYNKRFK